MLLPFLYLLERIILLYQWVIIASIVIHWLIAFKIVNPYQPFVRKVNEVLRRLTEPVLSRIRRFVPAVAGIDLSPIILFLFLYFCVDMLHAIAGKI